MKNAAISAFGTAAYIAAISYFLFYGTKFIGLNGEESVIMPALMLSLLVFSAAITGTLIFGRPVMWYIDGKKKEALSLLAYTLGMFFGIIAVALAVIAIIQ
jgi:hypothetical protein